NFMSNILVAYFSASGVTAKAAEAIAKAVGGELYEIIPQAPYTSADLNWKDKHSRSSTEMQDEQSRPALAAPVRDLSEYDTVFVGFPIWWGVEPRVVDTFLDSRDLTGKTVIPFATSGGSGMAYAQQHLQGLYPALRWEQGELVTARTAAGWAKAALGM